MVLAEVIRDASAYLFAVNTNANEYTVDQAKNKLRTLFAGKKTDLVIGHIAKTFKALCDYADFSKSRIPPIKPTAEKEEKAKEHPPKERESSVKTAELRKEIGRASCRE